jgi:hypothetical protein
MARGKASAMILLWGVPQDTPLARVHDALLRRGHPVRLLDQRVTARATAELSVDGRVSATVRTADGDLELARCTAAYLRPYSATDFPAVRRAGPGSEIWDRALLMDELLMDWAELTGALVVNRPSAMATNTSKPFQARYLRGAGFSVPDTIITTDPDAVREFRAKHQRVVYKSISGVRSIVSELTDAHVARLDAVAWCPTQFQERVAGTDYRVHVVGEEIFAAEIRSDAVDYRYAAWQGHAVDIHGCTIPDDVAERCLAATRSTGLTFGGVDLKRTPEGEWYCFEVNPSPGFTFYQDATDQRIDEAVARLLIGGGVATNAGRVTDGHAQSHKEEQ